MQAEREAPAAGSQSPLRRQATASAWAVPQETPVARTPSKPPTLTAQTVAEAPGGPSVDGEVSEPLVVPPEVEDDEEPPQPPSRAAPTATATIRLASLAGTSPT